MQWSRGKAEKERKEKIRGVGRKGGGKSVRTQDALGKDV